MVSIHEKSRPKSEILTRFSVYGIEERTTRFKIKFVRWFFSLVFSSYITNSVIVGVLTPYRYIREILEGNAD